MRSGCACPGDILTYECTVEGELGGTTVWEGTVFDCPQTYNAILLFHNHYSSVYKILRACNNGAIVARLISVEGNNYTSQLNVTVTPDTAGKTIMCLYDNGRSRAIQFSTVTALSTPGLSSWLAIVSQSHVVV